MECVYVRDKPIWAWNAKAMQVLKLEVISLQTLERVIAQVRRKQNNKVNCQYVRVLTFFVYKGKNRV